jgi:hypothetical protein
LFTSTIITVTALVAVAVGGGAVDVAVFVGTKVKVAVGRMGVSVGVSVYVGVGKGVGRKGVEVGKGVNVGKSKLNRGVGEAGVPVSVRTIGLAGGGAALRGRNKGIVIAQRQQSTSRNEPGRRSLPNGPWRR